MSEHKEFDNILELTKDLNDERTTVLVSKVLQQHGLVLEPRINITVGKLPAVKDSFEQHVKESKKEVEADPAA